MVILRFRIACLALTMLEILGLIVAVTIVGGLARAQGGSATVVISAALAGWFLIRFTGTHFISTEQEAFFLILASWIWILVIVAYLIFNALTRAKKV